MAVSIRSASARLWVLQGFWRSPFVEMLLFVPACCRRTQLNCSVGPGDNRAFSNLEGLVSLC